MYVPLVYLSNFVTIYICASFLLMWFYDLPDLVCVFYKVTEQIGLIIVQTYLFGLESAVFFKIYIPLISSSWTKRKLIAYATLTGFLTTLPFFGALFILRGQIMWSLCTGELHSFFNRRKQAKSEINWLTIGLFAPYLLFSMIAIRAYSRSLTRSKVTRPDCVPEFHKALALQVTLFIACVFYRAIFLYVVPSDIDVNTYKFLFWLVSYATFVVLGPSASILVLLFNKGYREKVFSSSGGSTIAPLGEA